MKINNISNNPFQAGYKTSGFKTRKDLTSFFKDERQKLNEAQKTTLKTFDYLESKEAQNLMSQLPEKDMVLLSVETDYGKDATPVLLYCANDKKSQRNLENFYGTIEEPSLCIDNSKDIKQTVSTWLKEIKKIIG